MCVYVNVYTYICVWGGFNGETVGIIRTNKPGEKPWSSGKPLLLGSTEDDVETTPLALANTK